MSALLAITDATSLWSALGPEAKALVVFGVATAIGALVLGKIPLRYNVRNILIRWRTTVMTAVAFTLVVALVTVMLAFVNGMYKLTEGSGQVGNLMILSEGSTDELQSNLGFSDIGDIANQPGVLRDARGKALCSRETYLVVVQPRINPAPDGPQRRFIQLRGVDDPAISGAVHGIDLYEDGAWFSEAGVQPLASGGGKASDVIQAVIGEGLAGELGRDRKSDDLANARNPKRLEVGDTFALRDRRWLVVGIMKSAGTTFDSEVWAKQSLVGPMFGKTQFTSLVLRTADDPAAQRLKEFFNKDYRKARLSALVEREYFSNLNATNQQFSYAIGFIAFWVAVGGIAGTMNAMFAAISQRTKDIGVLRILGFARWQVLISFLLESILIALIGGTIGCALGSLADGWTATSIVSGAQGGGGKSVVLKLVVDGPIIAKGLLLALSMGALGGLVPSLYAMRVRPLESLR